MPKAIALLILISTALAAAGPAVPGDDAAAAHVLNRLAYGARPGDVARVTNTGVSAWIETQLHPERLADDGLAARLERFTTIGLDSRTLSQDHDMPAADRKDRLAVAELGQAKLLRAVYSERQLEAVLLDFWFNHFNVFAGKGPTRTYLTEYERDVIRPHVLGRFRDLLGATAKSSAMLFYLDNWQSADPASAERIDRLRQTRRRTADAPPRPPRGLNENYARELLELHTLGVDGGYTQQDVVDVARAFTGWTMRPREGTGFQFAPALHDRGAKIVLGHPLRPGRGIEDGEEVLDLLAAHTATATFIARKLAVRFVSDAPPETLVDRVAARFLATKGDLREVVRTIVTAPEFFAADVRQVKLKTPLEFVASALRATGADVVDARPLVRTLRDLGMPPYFCQPPTGYGDTAEAWAASGALVTRLNLATSLGSGTLGGVRLSATAPRTQGQLALTIGSPAFQYR